MNQFQSSGRSIRSAILRFTIASLCLLSSCTKPTQHEEAMLRARSLKILEGVLHGKNALARAAATKAMNDSGDPAVLPWLSISLKDSDATVRLFAVEAAADLNPSIAIRFIESGMADPDSSVRLTAVRVMSRMKADAVLPILRNALKDPDPDVQLVVLGTLVGFQGMGTYPNALIIFNQGLRNKNPEIRIMTVTGLGKTEDVRALPLLTKALGDPESAVRSYAAQALSNLHTDHAIPMLSAALNDQDSDVRSEAALALGSYRTPEVLLLIQHAAEDPDPMVRLSAAVSLAKHNHPDAMGLFQSALADPDFGIRSAAARSIGEISLAGAWSGAKQAGSLLVPMLKDSSSRVRSAAARALGMIENSDALDALRKTLADVEPSVQCYASGAILRIINQKKNHAEARDRGIPLGKEGWSRLNTECPPGIEAWGGYAGPKRGIEWFTMRIPDKREAARPHFLFYWNGGLSK
jgi:HEAT repeat protein